MATRSTMHKRSRSDPIPRKFYKGKASEIFEESTGFNLNFVLQKEIEQLKCLVKPRNKQSWASQERTSLNQEILQLRERLHEEILVRRELDKVLRCKMFLEDSRNEDSVPQAAKKLVREISALEMEVIYLERYLLSLYRKMFNRRTLSHVAVDEQPESDLTAENLKSEKENFDFHQSKLARSPGNLGCLSPQKVLEGSGIFRSHSSLSHRSGYSFRMSPQAKDSYHQSLPLSMLEQSDIEALIGANSDYVSENVPETLNGLSQEMIKCISSVFLQLADPPPLIDNQEPYSPFHGKERAKFACPYDHLFMVKSIRRDSEKLAEVEPVLKHYRSLVCRLEGVNPKKLNHEEKLAFWINVHNSLVMHAILVYGAPKSNLKRISQTLKAAYNIGGRTLNLDTIQTSILNCRVSRPGQRLRFLFSSKSKSKAGDATKDYAIDHSEPLLHFALSSGSFSDPSVRIYTPKNVMLELEAAREEYIRSNIGITKDNKVLLPKLLEQYTKDIDLCPVGVTEMIENSLPYNARNRIRQCQNRKSGKFSIDWIAHDFTFGFLLPKEFGVMD